MLARGALEQLYLEHFRPDQRPAETAAYRSRRLASLERGFVDDQTLASVHVVKVMTTGRAILRLTH